MNQPLPNVKPDSILRDRLYQNQGVINRLYDLLSAMEEKLEPVLTPSEPTKSNSDCISSVGPAMSEFESALVQQNQQMDALGVRINNLLNRLAV